MTVDGFVLAGGRSRRMGFDKARAPWGELPLALAAARSLGAVCARVVVIRRVDDGLPWVWEDGTPAEVVHEPAEGEPHPLWGVVTALERAHSDRVAILAADVPAVSGASWEVLVAAAPSVAVDEDGRVHPLVAVLPRSLAAEARSLAAAGSPAHRLTVGCARIVVPRDELADHDDPSSLPVDPVTRLLARIPIRDAQLRARVAEGERERLRARGIVLPPHPPSKEPP